MIPGGETNVAKLAGELGVALTLINKTKTSTYCSYCGGDNNSFANYCAYCQNKLSDSKQAI